MNPELVLSGVFIQLVRRGFPLGVRDYLDALRALRAGYGFGDRRRLLWLCQTLWARSEEDSRAIQLVFDEIPPPTEEEVAEVASQVPGTRMRPPGGDEERGPQRPDDENEPRAGVTFDAAGSGGLAVPRAQVPRMARGSFILTPREVVPLRSLVVAWRRFRTALRAGPRVEVDLDATIAEKCRTGVLHELALVPARRNQARIVVLVDASPSMEPWRGIDQLLQTSLRQGQLGEWRIFWFANLPEGTVYEDRDLLQPVSIESTLKSSSGSSLLVVSDAGATRGGRNPSRVEETASFIKSVRSHWRPIVWLNPAPRSRWAGTAAAISRHPDVAMFELAEEGVTAGVDVLRGRSLVPEGVR